jgi:hypothetical protein
MSSLPLNAYGPSSEEAPLPYDQQLQRRAVKVKVVWTADEAAMVAQRFGCGRELLPAATWRRTGRLWVAIHMLTRRTIIMTPQGPASRRGIP